MTKEELEHDHIKEIAENYVNESWGSYLDLDEVDLVMAGIGVGKIIASEQKKQIEIDAEQIRALQKQNGELTDKVRKLERQFEKLIDFVLSKTECCDICPITDTCINSEGTCPYAGILAKGEEEVTREWLMKFISRR